jgi:D-aspartate ligase
MLQPRREVGGPPAVLLGGEAAALSAARSLGRRGVKVYALGHRDDPVRRSRYCAVFVDVGGGRGIADRYLAWLEQRVARGAVLMPCDDDSVELIARTRDWLVELGYLPVEGNDEVALAMLDKEQTYALARRVGTHAPRTMRIADVRDIEGALAHCGLPCALKPLFSHHYAAYFGAHNKVIIVEDAESCGRALAEMAALEVAMMATEIIPGGDGAFRSYYTYLDEHGEPLLQFTKRKIRQYPVGFGLTTYQVAEWHPEVAAVGLRYLQGIGLRGAANLEFKLDPRDGELKLIECNYRLTESNELVAAAGIDLPLLSYRRAASLPPPTFNGFREGVHVWNVIQDIHALKGYRERSEWTLLGWARSLLRVQHFPVWSHDDPLPSAVAGARHARRALRRVRGTGAPRVGAHSCEGPDGSHRLEQRRR